jgi:hypothetical protein
MESDWGRFLVKSSLLSSAFFLIGYIGIGVVFFGGMDSIDVIWIALSYIFYILPIFFILGIPLTLCVKKLVRNIPNKIIKELLSQILVTLLAFLIQYLLAEFLSGEANLTKENFFHSILLSYFSAMASLYIAIRKCH